LDVILVCYQIGSDKDATVRQNGAECTLRKRRFLLPRPKIIVSLAGYIHSNEGDLFRLGSRGRNSRFLLFQRAAECDENNAEGEGPMCDRLRACPGLAVGTTVRRKAHNAVAHRSCDPESSMAMA